MNAVNKKSLIIVTLIAFFSQLTFAHQAAPAAVAAATGTVYYVATNGNDANPGTIDRPWKNIQKAANTLRAGDTVQVRGGKYFVDKRGEGIKPANSGGAGSYITYMAYPGEQVTIQGNYATAGDYVWFGMDIKGQSYIQIQGFTIRGFSSGVMCRAPGHHIVIRGNTFEYNSSAGVNSTGAASGSKQACDYLSILGNRIHHNGYYDNGQPATREDEGWGSGISINAQHNPFTASSDYSTFHSVISGNTIYHNYDGTGGDLDSDADHTDGNGIILDQGGNFPPALIENNVIFDNGGRCIHPFGTQNVWIIGNTCYKNNTDPLFRDPGSQGEIAAYAAGNDRPQNIHVLNNIAYGLDGRQITYFPDIATGELDMRNNVWYGQPQRETYSPYGTNFIRSDPLFVSALADPSRADFHLRANSPAINIGANVSMLQVVDFDNAPRPQSRPQGSGYDAGAYEYTGQIVAPTPVHPTGPGPMIHHVFIPVVSVRQ